MNKKTFFSFGKSSETLGIIFDIGSGSVGGALVLISKENIPKIIYTIRYSMSITKDIKVENFISSMGKTLQRVIDDIQKNGMKHTKFTNIGNMIPETIHCTFSSPWHVSETKNIKIFKEKSFTITKLFLSKVIKKEVKEIQKKQDEVYSSEKITNSGSFLIEKRITNIKINGYEVDNPEGKRADNIEMSLFTSFIPKEVINLVENKIKSTFHIDEIVYNSFILSLFSFVRDAWGEEDNFLIIDVSGEVTEISVVKDGSIFNMASFPIGKNTFIRNLSKKLKVSSSEAISLISILTKKDASKDLALSVHKEIKETEENWKNNFQKVIFNLSEGIFLPNLVFLTTDSPFDIILVDAIEEINKKESKVDESNFISKVISRKSFVVNLVTSKKLSNFVDLKNKKLNDPFFVIDLLFMDKAHYPTKELLTKK